MVFGSCLLSCVVGVLGCLEYWKVNVVVKWVWCIMLSVVVKFFLVFLGKLMIRLVVIVVCGMVVCMCLMMLR